MLAGLIGAGAALHMAQGTECVLDVFAAIFGIACVARLGSALALARMGQGIDVTPRKRVRLRSMPQRLRDTPRGSIVVARYQDRNDSRFAESRDRIDRISFQFVAERDDPNEVTVARHGNHRASLLLKRRDAIDERR